MSKAMVAVVPDCFGLFFDATAPECKMCADNKACKERAMKNGNGYKTETTDERVELAYPAGKGGLDRAIIQESLESKLGQISKLLARGSKVTLISDHTNSLRVLTPATPLSQEPIMAEKKIKPNTKPVAIEEDDDDEDVVPAPKAVKKGAPAPAAKKAAKPVIEEEDDEDEGEEVEADDDEEEEEAPKPKGKKAKAVEVEDEEEEAPKGKFKPMGEKKAKKEAKPKAELNKAQAEFKEALKTTYKEDKALLKFAKELGVTWNKKEDARINRMLCVMAIQKHLGAIGGGKKKK